LHLISQALRLTLHVQRRQTCANCVILQRRWRAEDGHQTVTGELVHGAAVLLHHRRTATNEARRRGDVHRTHHIGEQHGHLFELSV
jgi:hypothetical protein